MGTNRYFLRQKLVAYAPAHGVKAAAGSEQSRRPRHCPHQTDAALKQHIVLESVVTRF